MADQRQAAKPGHNIYMAAIEINRLLAHYHVGTLPNQEIEDAIVRGLFAPLNKPQDRRLGRADRRSQ